MRTLFIGVLAANLVGCAAQMDLKTVIDAKGARSAKFTNPQPRSSTHRKSTRAIAQSTKHSTATKISTQRKGGGDPVTEKAKSSIAAMMENPASAEFSGLKRAVKNVLDRPDDTICGFVRGRSGSGQDTGTMPFLYIVRHDDRDDEAYLVNGKSLVSETVHSALCK